MELNLKNRVVIITGGADGIGRAAASAFATEGAHVAIWDINPRAPEVAGDLTRNHGTRAIALRVDVANESSVNQAAAETLKQLGRIDHLVHCAAIGSGKFGFPFTNLQPADWPKVLQVNIMGMTHIAHAIAPIMAQQRTGTMVFVASVAGQMGSQTDPPYSASKAANINFAQCLAKDMAPQGVRVNTICPGMVKTTLNRAVWQAWHDAAPEKDRLTYEEWGAKKIAGITPLGTWQTPEAVADMILFLSSERAAHVTGQTINVDGGSVMHW